jgi:hypothetical protein
MMPGGYSGTGLAVILFADNISMADLVVNGAGDLVNDDRICTGKRDLF